MAKTNRLPPGPESLDTLTRIIFDQFAAEMDEPAKWTGAHQMCYVAGMHIMAMRWLGLYARAGMISPRQLSTATEVFLTECQRRIDAIDRVAKARTTKRSTPETGPPDSEQEAVLTFARGVEQSGSSRGS